MLCAFGLVVFLASHNNFKSLQYIKLAGRLVNKSFYHYFCYNQKDKLKDFLDKKERGELLIQKASNLLGNILKKVKTFFLITVITTELHGSHICDCANFSVFRGKGGGFLY